MYSVTKRIDFCYGHRLLDYDGICKHPHGHNAVAEIEVRTESLDLRDMVCDFSDIKRVIKGWIDRELDHKMILRRDDPLLEPLRELGEPVFVVDHNPTVEQIAKLIFDQANEQGFSVVRVTVWETPTSFATYYGTLQSSDAKPTSELTTPTLLRQFRAHRTRPRGDGVPAEGACWLGSLIRLKHHLSEPAWKL